MRRFLTLLVAIVVVGLSSALAQTKTVSGKVISAEDNQPIPGVNVFVKSAPTVGIMTDANGNFTLKNIPANAKTLVFRFVGYQATEMPITGDVVNATLASENQKIDEVVVTAYGVVKKQAFTGTAAVVKADQLQNLKISSVSKALQGLATGVMVVNSSGQPGENATIRVRGIGSFSGNSEPLIVVDGVIFNGNMNNINPNDIESYTVLKDANSTALYGSRAANGVILLTTKMGRAGKSEITFSASYGLSTRAVDDYKYLNAGQYYEQRWRSLYNNFLPTTTDAEARQLATDQVQGLLVYSPFDIDDPVGTDGKIKSNAKLLWNQDWNDALLRVGKRQEYNLQALGGTDKNRYLISVGYLHDDGIVKESKFDRYNVRGKIDSDLTSWLKVGLNMGLSYSEQNYPTQGGTSIRNSIGAIRMMSSIYPAYQRNRDGSFVLDAKGSKIPDYGTAEQNPWGFERPVAKNSNSLGTFMFDVIEANRLSIQNNGFAEIKILPFLTYRSTLGVEYFLLSNKEYYNNSIGDGVAYGGRSEREHRQTTMINWTNTLVFDKTFNEIHHINLLAGTESNDWKTNYLGAETRGFDFADQELDYGANKIKASSNSTASRNFRYLARANYDLNNRYHISASYTRDGSSYFYRDVRWGDFYSVGLSYDILNESFADSWRSVVSTLKLRGSYGTSGSQDIGSSRFPYMGTYDTGSNILGSLGSIVGSLENRLLTWEKQNQLDLGVDFGFLKGRVTGAVTYFNRKSSDLLMARPLPISAGITSYNDNVGEVQNTGLETEVKGVLFKNSDWYFDLGANITFQKNEVTALPEEQKDGFNRDFSKRVEVGKSMYSWYLREFAGVDPVDGKAMWYKDVVDPTTNEITGKETTKVYADGTRYIVGDALPKVLGGINANLSYKGISLSVIGAFSLGSKIADFDKAGLMHMMSASRNGYQASSDMLKAWSKEGDITNVPKLGDDSESFSSMSTRWLVSGDYFRIRNITLGYDLTNLSLIKNLGFKQLKAFVSADNYFTFFGSQGLDPEVGIDGVSDNNSSPVKVISFGLNIQL